jgi:adenine-specific DNA-methyltransferase
MPTLDWLNRAHAFTVSARVPYRLLEQVSVHARTPGGHTTPPAIPAAPAQAELVKEPAAAPTLPSKPIHDNLLIQGDKRPASGNVLTSAVLDALLELHARTPHPEAPLVVYGEACRLGEARLALARVTFKHIPYDVKAR